MISPIIPPGEADIIIGLEVIEAARAAPHFLRRGGVLLVNTEAVAPVSVVAGYQKMPEAQALWEALSPLRPRMVAVPATQWALELGRGVLANTVLLGALASLDVLPLDRDHLLQAIEDTAPLGTAELNRQAFRRGASAIAGEVAAITPGPRAGSEVGSGTGVVVG
jgi:indolepyruvate ferredoxin oxidoreductase beta subunit